MISPYPAADGLVRVYPAPAPNGSGLVWAHGGGFGAGDLDMPEADAVARSLAAAGTTVISVDYRLVGDGCRYPAPSDDILTAWIWTLAHADDLGVERIAIGGASAGANLVTGATLRMLNEPGPQPGARPGGGIRLPDLVVLAYPTLLAVQPEPDAALRTALDTDPIADRFGPDVVREMYENFLGGPVDDAPLYAVPGLATSRDLAGFPPTLMINSDADELRVSGEVFAATLRAASRELEAVTEAGTQHGHLNRPNEPAASVSLERISRRLADLVSATTAIADLPPDVAIRGE